ncbi:MAG: LysE family translocator [Alphaproteobacteria bacterium]|nr:LysE family translocator [Alphaproteobacteria bacterium]
MLSLHSYLLYCSVYAIAIAVPGPGVVAIVARALGSGFRATIPAVIGTAVGDWIMLSLSVFGLALVAQTMGGLFLIVKLAGAAYLVYLGYRYWTAPVTDVETLIPSGARQSFLSQLSLILGNPKTIAFFVALLPTVVELNRLNVFGYLQLVAATAVLIPAIMLSYAALASHARVFLASRKARGRLNKGAAVVMVGAGVGVAAS